MSNEDVIYECLRIDDVIKHEWKKAYAHASLLESRDKAVNDNPRILDR